MWAKQSTAATIIVGPILDSAGAEYASAVIGDLSISKNGGTLTAMAAAATLTHIANGQYTLVTTTGNLDTLGRAQVTCNKSTYQMPAVNLMVVPAMVFDSMILGTDVLQADVTQLLGTAWLTPAVAGTPDVNAKQFGGATVTATTSVTIPASSTLATTAGAVGSVTGAVASVTGAVGSVTAVSSGAITSASFAAGAIDASAIATDAIGSDEIAATAAVEIAAAVWDRVLSAANHNIANSAGRRVRQLAAATITGGTAQAGSSNSITLASGESSTNEIYDSNLIVIVGGTGAGQSRVIVEYNGTTKVAIVGQIWEVNPDVTSEYEIIASHQADIAHHGLAQGGAAASITLASTASAANDSYLGSLVYLSTSNGTGQTRLITAYNGTTKVATVSPAWVTEPTSATVYKVIPGGRTIVDSLAANSLTASALATDAVTEIQSGLATSSSLSTAQTSIDDLPTNAELATAITTSLTTALTEGYRSTNATGSVRDLLYEILQSISEFTISGTTKTVKKLDGSTTAKVYTLNDGTLPTGITETS